MGRPKKYTERTLRKAVEDYFDGITREVGLTEKVDTGRKDSSGHKIFENVPVINKRGEQVKITEYLVPPPWADCARPWRSTAAPGRNTATKACTRSFPTRQRARGGACASTWSSSC